MDLSFACLDEPVTTKYSTDDSGNNVTVGTCIMQGWRKTQQDAYNSCINYDDNVSLFAVYDGHGGHEVATYCAKELPEFLKRTYEYNKGDIRQALIHGISEFDITLTRPEVREILKQISCIDTTDEFNNKHGVKIESNDEHDYKNNIVGELIPETILKNDEFHTATDDDNNKNNKYNNYEINDSDKNLNSSASNDEISLKYTANDLEKNIESSMTIDMINSLEDISDEGSLIITTSSKKSLMKFDDDDSDESDDSNDSDDNDDNDKENIITDDDDVGYYCFDDDKIVKNRDDSDNNEDDYDDYDELYDDDDDDDDYDTFKMHDQPGYKSGCTAIVAIIVDNELYVGNTGDSRCVLCRNGKAYKMSIDRLPFMRGEKEHFKAGQKISFREQVYRKLRLSRSLGDHKYKRNALFPFQGPIITASPQVHHHVIDPKQDQFLILASNGIWECMSSKEVVEFINARINFTENLSKICEELFDHCLSLHSDHRGCDNMSAVLIKFKSSTLINDNYITNNNKTACKIISASLKPPVDNILDTINTEKLLDECTIKMKYHKINTVTS